MISNLLQKAGAKTSWSSSSSSSLSDLSSSPRSSSPLSNLSSSSSSSSSSNTNKNKGGKKREKEKEKKRKITHVIFDLDGLLLDTEWVYEQGTREVLRRYEGKEEEFDATDLRRRMMGRKAGDIAKLMVEELSLPLSPQQFTRERTPLLQEKFSLCKAMPGAIELVTYLHQNGIPMAVATSTSTENFGLKTHNRAWWFAMFDLCVKGDDPELLRGKPAPDIFLLAAKRLGCTDPEHCLVFEDSPAGVEAAVSAGMHVVWVPGLNAVTTIITSATTTTTHSNTEDTLITLATTETTEADSDTKTTTTPTMTKRANVITCGSESGNRSSVIGNTGTMDLEEATTTRLCSQRLASLEDFDPTHWNLPPFSADSGL